jgi:hypothetical protein
VAQFVLGRLHRSLRAPVRYRRLARLADSVIEIRKS